MKPQVVGHELNKLVADDALVAADSGTNTSWCARYIDIKDAMQFAVSGNLASMACGLPYAIAGAIAHPGRQVIAFVGDGGFTMLMGELATCVKYKLDVKVVVIKNDSLGQIKWEQISFLGNPEYGCELHPIDFVAFARACGASGFAIDDPTRCADIMGEALATPGPVLIEATVDPDEPPLPPPPLRVRQEFRRSAGARYAWRGQDSKQRRQGESTRADLASFLPQPQARRADRTSVNHPVTMRWANIAGVG